VFWQQSSDKRKPKISYQLRFTLVSGKLGKACGGQQLRIKIQLQRKGSEDWVESKNKKVTYRLLDQICSHAQSKRLTQTHHIAFLAGS
jgi:hypothetical protein